MSLASAGAKRTTASRRSEKRPSKNSAAAITAVAVPSQPPPSSGAPNPSDVHVMGLFDELATDEPKIARKLLDLRITFQSLSALNRTLVAAQQQKESYIERLQVYVQELEAKLGIESSLTAAAAQSGHGSTISDPDQSNISLEDHQHVLGRLCDRTQQMLYEGQRAINNHAPEGGDVESASAIMEGTSLEYTPRPTDGSQLDSSYSSASSSVVSSSASPVQGTKEATEAQCASPILDAAHIAPGLPASRLHSLGCLRVSLDALHTLLLQQQTAQQAAQSEATQSPRMGLGLVLAMQDRPKTLAKSGALQLVDECRLHLSQTLADDHNTQTNLTSMPSLTVDHEDGLPTPTSGLSHRHSLVYRPEVLTDDHSDLESNVSTKSNYSRRSRQTMMSEPGPARSIGRLSMEDDNYSSFSHFLQAADASRSPRAPSDLESYDAPQRSHTKRSSMIVRSGSLNINSGADSSVERRHRRISQAERSSSLYGRSKDSPSLPPSPRVPSVGRQALCDGAESKPIRVKARHHH
ncbi:hypothetical protein RI367_004293 [Sorochytrium milnesiophthora]